MCTRASERKALEIQMVAQSLGTKLGGDWAVGESETQFLPVVAQGPRVDDRGN